MAKEQPFIKRKRNPAEHLKPWQFKPGHSGNLKGRPDGVLSLKTKAKNYIQTLSDEETLEFLKGLDKKVVWEMAEGKPDQDMKLEGGLVLQISKEVADKNNLDVSSQSTKSDSER